MLSINKFKPKITNVIPECNAYSTTPNVMSFNGEPVSTATTLAACQSACTADPACVAFDFNFITAGVVVCHLHKAASQLLPSNQLAGVAGINQYTITRCRDGQ